MKLESLPIYCALRISLPPAPELPSSHLDINVDAITLVEAYSFFGQSAMSEPNPGRLTESRKRKSPPKVKEKEETSRNSKRFKLSLVGWSNDITVTDKPPYRANAIRKRWSKHYRNGERIRNISRSLPMVSRKRVEVPTLQKLDCPTSCPLARAVRTWRFPSTLRSRSSDLPATPKDVPKLQLVYFDLLKTSGLPLTLQPCSVSRTSSAC